jgi:hypothetical protein
MNATVPDVFAPAQADAGTRSLCIHCNKCMPTIYRGTRCVLAEATPPAARSGA